MAPEGPAGPARPPRMTSGHEQSGLWDAGRGRLLSECRARTGGAAAIAGVSARRPGDTSALALQKRAPQAAGEETGSARRQRPGRTHDRRHTHSGEGNVARGASSRTHQHPVTARRPRRWDMHARPQTMEDASRGRSRVPGPGHGRHCPARAPSQHPAR